MGQAQIENPIRYPLDGADLAFLSGSADPRWPRSTHHRRLGRLISLGLIDRFATALPAASGLARAARAAAEERRDLFELLASRADLAVLASLPDRSPWFPAHLTSGVHRHTWRRRINGLARKGAVLRPQGRARLNPLLPALATLVAEYRQLYEQPPPPWTTWPWLAFHQHGCETFWRAPGPIFPTGLAPVGPSTTHPAFTPLLMPWHLAYGGPRELDALDHALAALIAHRVPATPSTPADTRITGLIAAAIDPALLDSMTFQVRAHYYGARDITDAIRASVDTHKGPIWEAATRMRSEFGVKEGLLTA